MKITTSAKGSEPTALELRVKYHPLRIFTFLVLMGISSAFLFLSVSYFLTTLGTGFNNFQLPLIFHANTIIILVSSYSMGQTRKAILADDWKGYSNGLLVTAALGIAFTVFQIVGWQQLIANGVKLSNNVAGAYLYVISGLHLVHLVVGIVILGWFLVRSLESRNDQVKALLFEIDPFSKMRVNLLSLYWHFVDGLWIYLYLFFLANIYVATHAHFKPFGI
ncbi:MAG: cytochrome c oxidase subunit 3 [Chitinophagales bacterium]